MRTAPRILSLSLALLGCATSAPAPAADDLDTFVEAQMAQRKVPGLSLAIVQDGRIVEARAYGVTESGGTERVTPTTLFQAGSISKPVSALGALRLVEQGRLDLDADVNGTLKSWQVPANGFTVAQRVTLRRLLSHTAGLTVHGFPGYDVDAPKPTVVQVLDGAPPANTPPVRVDVEPGSRWRYSGGGYTVMQQMVVDVTGQPFPEYMRQAVLAPIGMTHSSFEQPLPPAMAAATARGHYQDQRPVRGRWHVYPEMAAAGLWTTPTDLARVIIEVQQSLAGTSSKVLSPAMTRRMLTEVKDGYGLGFGVQGAGRMQQFSHGGRDEGFDAWLAGQAETGQGVVIMINANDNSRMVSRIASQVARRYRWPTAPTYAVPVATAEPLPLERLRGYTGRYELSNNNMITFVAADGRLYSLTGGLPDEEFVPLGGDRFAVADRPVRVTFTRDAGGAVTGLTWAQGDRERLVPRVGPLVAMLERQPDRLPRLLTMRLDSTLRLMAQGPAGTARATGLTEGARRDFGQGTWPAVVGYRSVELLGAEDVSGRGLERHGHPVDRIAYYTLTTDRGQKSLLVWLTKEGLITDFDDVDDR